MQRCVPRYTRPISCRPLFITLFCLLWVHSLAHGTTTAPALLLATTYEDQRDLERYWVSEKLDGVRARWDGRQLISRGGHPLRAPTWFTADFPRVAMDGELWMGRGRFEEVSGAVRRQVPDESQWRQIRFMVFDLPLPGVPFGRRLEELQRLLVQAPDGGHPSPYIAPVEQFRVADRETLMQRLDTVMRQGGEGLMLHRDDGLYLPGRSNALLKLKPYMDAEAVVVAHLPGRGRFTGLLGALLVETPEGLRFRIGSGFSHAQRADPPAIGATITYTHHGTTRNGVPRFASFLRERDDAF